MNKHRMLAAGIAVLILTLILSGCVNTVQTQAAAKRIWTGDSETQYTKAMSKLVSIDYEAEYVANTTYTHEEAICFRYPCYGGTVSEVYCHAGDTVKKGDMLMELDTSDKALEMAEQAKLHKINELQYKVDLKNATTDAEIEVAELRWKIAKSRYNEYMAGINGHKLYAPMDGVILTVHYGVDKWVDANTPAVTMADPESLVIEIQRNAESQTGVESMPTVGQEAVLRLEGTSTTYKSTFLSVCPNRPDLEKREINMHTYLSISDLPKEKQRPGVKVWVRFTAGHLDNVIVVPKIAVKKAPTTGMMVEVILNNKRLKKPVETGLEYEGNLVITKGLEEGEEVLME